MMAKALLLKPFFVAFIFTSLATYAVIAIARYFGLVDNPKKRQHPAHTHKGIIPRAGGLAIFLGIIAAIGLSGIPVNKQLIGIISGALVLLVTGLLDDKFDLSPYLRFGLNVLAALLVVGSGVGIPFVSNPFNGVLHLDIWRVCFDFQGPHCVVVWQDLAAILWIVWCLNMVGWSGGVEGQLPGFVGVAALTIGILSFRTAMVLDLSQWVVATLAFIVAGSYFGFWPWNFYPQRIMPGYSGKALAGYFLAVLSIAGAGKIGTLIVVLGVPMIDAGYAMIRRLARGQSPFLGDREHLHHRLLEIGWGRRRISLFYFGVSVILGLAALLFPPQFKLGILILLILGVGVFFLWLANFSSFSKPCGRDNG